MILHPPVIVPPTKKVDEMFDFFRDKQVQAAAVLNEFGGVDGLVTLKSVLSFVFGKVTPESAPHRVYAQLAENVFEVAADMKLNDFEDLTNFGITDPRMTSIGGVVLRALDRLPRVGDAVIVEGVELRVLEMQGLRIARLRASKGHQALPASEPVETTSTDISDTDTY